MKWLTIVGIGEDGVAGLGDAARKALAEARIVFGGGRHLQLASSIIGWEARPWQSPFSVSVEAVLAERGRPICVLASGDPFHYGIGATLSRYVDAAEMEVIPHASAFSLAAARLGWPLQDIVTLSLHGRPLELIRPHLHPGTRIVALTSDEHGPAALAQMLVAWGFGGSHLSVLEALGGPNERIRSGTAETLALDTVDPLNVCAIIVEASPDTPILPLTTGLDESFFEHDGQITKREVRALTLSALAPRRGELLWDIGAGSGSVGIEWMLADPSMRAIAIEADAERAARIGRNAAALGAPDIRVIVGEAPVALAGLQPPDAIFIGGGGSDPGVIEEAISALRPGGRLVANAVTTQMEALLLARQAALGGRLIRIDIARTAPIGSMTGWRPAMPITQWVWTRP
jgi:precorrin-6B C5,15-methyltransferase / cobalt-precorrin-6B C5,C15-methyltransferase